MSSIKETSLSISPSEKMSVTSLTRSGLVVAHMDNIVPPTFIAKKGIIYSTSNNINSIVLSTQPSVATPVTSATLLGSESASLGSHGLPTSCAWVTSGI